MSQSGRARLLLFLAAHGLAQNRAISALLLIAVVCGVAFQIPNTANLVGYHDELFAQAVARGFGQLRIMPRHGQRFEVDDGMRKLLIAQPEVEATMPVLLLAGAVGRAGAFRNAAIIGADVGLARQPYRLVAGASLAPGDQGGVILGLSIARRMGAQPGETVELRVIFDGARVADDDAVGKYTMRVRGIAAGSFMASDALFVDRAFLADELGEPAAVSLVAVYTRGIDDVRPLAGRLATDLPDLEVRTWEEASVFAASAIRSGAVLATLSRTMAALAVVIPVWALLYIHVLHRQRDIAVLCAVGFGPGDVFWIYQCQALLVGLSGSLAGAALGYAMVRWFDAHPIFRIDTFVVRPVVTLATFLGPVLLSLAATQIASVLPAWRAARTDPAPILRERAS